MVELTRFTERNTRNLGRPPSKDAPDYQTIDYGYF